MKKILLTGGHAGTTALAVIEELEKHPGLEIYWIGSDKSVEGQNSKTLESKLLPSKNIKYFEINAGRLQRRFTRHTLISLARVPIGFIQSLKLILQIKPDLVLSFGGFVSVPVVISAWIFRIPIIIHEQTIAAGLANKISSYFATTIALARPQSAKYYGNKKTVWVGNPINEKITNLKKQETKKNQKPILYITGGSRGSQIINEVIFEALPELTKKYQVIHQTGELDFEKARAVKNSRYKAYEFLKPEEVRDIYSRASIVISRAGANTVAELAYLQIPTIFIPIPWTRYDEQTKNAKLAQDLGFAKVLRQEDLNKENLLKALEKFKLNINKNKLKIISKDINAAKNLSNEIFNSF